jgi:hypothetical protein
MQIKKQIRKYSVAPLFHKAALKFMLKWLGDHNRSAHINKEWIESVERFAVCNPHWPQHMAAQDWCGTYITIKGKRVWMPGAYRKNPDLAAALLNFLREKWAKLETSKPQKLKSFLAHNLTVKWENAFNSPEALAEWKCLAALQQVEEAKRPPVPVGGRAPMIEDQQIDDALRKIWSGRKHLGPGPDNLGNVPVWDLQDSDIAIAFEKSSGGFPVNKSDVREARRQVITDHRAGEKFAKKVLDKDGFLQVEGKSRRRIKRLIRTRK